LKTVSELPLRFFADENFSANLANMLAIFSEGACSFELHGECFQRGDSDEHILGTLKLREPKPIVLCGDGKILTNPARLAALKDADLHFVVLADGYVNLKWRDQVIHVFKAWGELCDTITKQHHPTIFRIRVNSKVEIVRRLSDWECHGSQKEKRQAGNRIA
jgi:PIN like domain